MDIRAIWEANSADKWSAISTAPLDLFKLRGIFLAVVDSPRRRCREVRDEVDVFESSKSDMYPSGCYFKKI